MERGTRIPRLVVAGTGSGVGKTTTMVALTRALQARGLKVAAFKCGPDYLDPTYHARATGGPCPNLDGWLMGHDAVVSTFLRVSAGADVALIEGMMGLFDGMAPDSPDGSAAQIAIWLKAPVLAVVDASGMASTIAAIGRGLAFHDPAVRVRGLWANRVGSPGHLELLQEAARGSVTPVLGGLPSEEFLMFPERHLGLFRASESAVPEEKLEAWGERLRAWNDLDPVLALARSAEPLAWPGEEPQATAALGCRIAFAHDAAFHFYYEDNLRRLERLGAELVPFSPLSDAALPRGTAAVYLGGGYPESYAEALSSNAPMQRALREFAQAGGPIHAECGGMMYLAQALRTLDGREHRMVGLTPGVAVMAPKLQALGYVEVETTRSTPLGSAGLRFRGHQFRYSTLEGAPLEGGALRVQQRGGRVHTEGHGPANVLASYVHAHWASNPAAAEGLVHSAEHFASAQR